MLYIKSGFPEEGEIVLCTVAQITHNSIFAKLDEYYNLTGMIHISEIAPGRIRNIRDYVTQDKKIVCRVLSVNKVKGYIDLSIRRVNESQKRHKNEQIKEEQKAEKMLETFAKEASSDVKKIYDTIAPRILSKYQSIYAGLYAAAVGEATLESFGLEPKLATDLTEFLKQRIKLPEVNIIGTLTLKTYEPDGVDLIKNTISKAIKKVPEVDVRYLSAGKYRVVIIRKDYKSAEADLKQFLETIEKEVKKTLTEFNFARN